MSNGQTEALSECNKCGRRYPSAPAGHIHKCGNCPGTCYPLATPSPAPSDTLEAVVKLLQFNIAFSHSRHRDDFRISVEDAETILAALGGSHD